VHVAAATYAEAEAKRLALMTELREVLDRLKQLNG
jgi:hypothetical protein